MDKNIGNKKRIIKWTVIAILLIWLLWGNLTVKLTTITVSDADLPDAFAGFKIAQISDLHNAEFGKDNHVLIDMLKNQAPDIIVITGDMVDSEHTDVDVAANFARQAVKIAPCYYVTGNHEGWLAEGEDDEAWDDEAESRKECSDERDHTSAKETEYDKLEAALIDAGVHVLHDESLMLKRDGETIQLIGMDDPTYRVVAGNAPFRSKLQELESEELFTVLLSHRPEMFDTYVQSNIDVVFAGHAHGGQVRIPFVGGLVAPGQGFLPEYDAGAYTDGTTTMVVSRGIGNSMVPVRVNNRPEVVVVELQR